jgi:hypothetical protein
MNTRRTARLAAFATALFCLQAAPSQAYDPAGKPRLYTDMEYVEQALAQPVLEIEDPKAVLEYVLNSLPDRVTVYPTENYYYFYFYHGGVKWAGNLRFDVETRDQGKLHMTYFRDFTSWRRDDVDKTVIWSGEDGVAVKKEADLVYSVALRGRSVIFQLNDLRGVEPPAAILGKVDRYLGPVFDESGIRFFLVYDGAAQVFLYLLDETIRQPDEFLPSEVSPEITLGRRTGFAFLQDRFLDRKILVGVHAENTGVNNYLDGPFDQLPDNFLKGDELRDAILEVSPEMEGEIDRFGNSKDDTVRYLIAPYMQYIDEYELGDFIDCAAGEEPPYYYQCFSLGPPPEDDPQEGEDKDGAPKE